MGRKKSWARQRLLQQMRRSRVLFKGGIPLKTRFCFKIRIQFATAEIQTAIDVQLDSK
jgi:hypothetical protein